MKGDEAKLVEILNNPNVTRYLSQRIPQQYTLEDAAWWINDGSKQGYIFAIVLDEQLIGCVGAEPGQFEHAITAEIGYWLAENYWGNGIATKALAMLEQRVPKNSSIKRLQASVFEGNLGSSRVLEKSGYQKQGYFPQAVCKNNEIYDLSIYGKALS